MPQIVEGITGWLKAAEMSQEIWIASMFSWDAGIACEFGFSSIKQWLAGSA